MGCCSSQRGNQKKKTYFTTNIRTFYRFGAVIGKGAFGTVKVGYRDGPNGEQIYAIKTINKVRVAENVKMIQEEFDILRKMDHPNIVRFYEMYEDEMFIYLVMEHCKGGNLLERVLSKGSFDEIKTKQVMRKLFSAIAYIHNQGVMHRDLKPENILFSTNDDDTDIKIIDFGLSKKLKGNDKDPQKQLQRKQSQVGTPLYIAPEIVTGIYNQKCDDWSVGCIMYVVLCSEPPFFSEHLKELIQKIKYKTVQFHQDEWQYVSNDCKQIIQGFLQKDPAKRMTCLEALNSNWCKQAIRKPLTIRINDNRKTSVKSTDCTPVNTNNIKGLKKYANSKQFKRELLRILVNQLNDKQIDKLTNKFKELDKDEDGFITPTELFEIMNKLGFGATKIEIEQLIKNMNPEESQGLQIKYSQFLAATIDLKQYLNKERLWSLFRYFDIEDKKYITKEDIQQALKREGREEMASDKVLKDIMLHDGQMNFKDFCQLMHDEMDSNEFFEHFEKLYSSPEKQKNQK